LSYLYPESPDAYDNTSEFEVARDLASNLPSNWHVISNVEWAKETKVGKRTGEIDFVILTPGNVIHVIELTFGTLELNSDGDLVFSTPAGKKSKSQQLRSNKSFVIDILRNARRLNEGLPTFDIRAWLLTPNTILDREIPSPLYEPTQIVDGSYSDPTGELCNRLKAGHDKTAGQVQPVILRIFMRELRYYLDPTTLIEGERRYVSGLSQTTEVILSVRCKTNRIVIDGVAGSGKTQIALAGLERARAKGLSAAIVSNTRVLPNLIQSEYGSSFPAHTYWTIQGVENGSLDEIFIEEAHHFQPTALESIEKKLKPAGKMFYLMDSCQNFDGRFVPPEDSAFIFLDTTYRVPKEVCNYLNLIAPLKKTIRCKSPQLDSYIAIEDSYESALDTTRDSLKSFIEFIKRRPELTDFCSLVFCGSQQEFELMITADDELTLMLEKICELTIRDKTSRVEDHSVRGRLNDLTLDRPNRPYKTTLDTIRRFQGSSNKFVWVTGLDEQPSIEGAARIFYSAVTRSRSRCEVFCTQAFSKQIAQSLA
jgi:hypothetical protein